MKQLSTFPILILFLLFAEPAMSDNLRKGLNAYQKGDYATAIKIWKPLAEQGDANVSILLGHIYAKGMGVSPDPKAAFKLFESAAEQGYSEAQYNAGILINLGKVFASNKTQNNRKIAIKWLKRAAEQGHIEAQFQLGKMCRFRSGEDTCNDDIAVKFLERAANQGSIGSQFLLGQMLTNGSVVQKDEKRGFQFLKRAAELGHGEAQLYLVGAYGSGNGTQKDHTLAAMWYYIFVFSNYSHAITLMNEKKMRESLTNAQLGKAQKLANKWLEKHRK